MRQLFLSIALIATALVASAQDNDKFIFNHLGAGVGIGTQGITIDAATMCTPYIGIRAGINIMPKFSYSDAINVNAEYDGYNTPRPEGYDIPASVDVKGELSLTTGHLLFDFYPGKRSIFHVTVGAYFGGQKAISAYNTEDGVLLDVYRWNSIQGNSGQKIAAMLGDYTLEPNSKGNVDACVKLYAVRPYFGIGFGRAVPKNRVGFQFDLGIQIWGKPDVYCNGEPTWDSVTDGIDDVAPDLVKIMYSLNVCPVISFRLTTRII